MTDLDELSDAPPSRTRWRALTPPVTVRGYIQNQWHDLRAVDIDDETRELRVEMPPVADANGVDVIAHRVLTPSLYQAPPGGL